MMAWERFASLVYESASSEIGFRANPHSGPAFVSERPQLRIDFDVLKSIESSANIATIKAYNLQPSHQAMLTIDRPTTADFDLPFAFIDRRLGAMGQGAPASSAAIGAGYVRLLAGHNGAGPQIFEGTIRDSSTVWRGPTAITQILAGDGDPALSIGVGNKVFGRGTSYFDLIRYIAKTMNVPIAGESDPRFGGSLPVSLQGRTASSSIVQGDPVAVMNQLARGLEFGWFIEDGELVILGDNGFREPYQIDVGAGRIIGEAQRIGSTAVRVEIPLEPAARIGARVRLGGEIRGTFRLDNLRHKGSNREGGFSTVLDLQNLDFAQTL